jgi:hypothetical protein
MKWNNLRPGIGDDEWNCPIVGLFGAYATRRGTKEWRIEVGKTAYPETYATLDAAKRAAEKRLVALVRQIAKAVGMELVAAKGRAS